ncbi:MAG: transcription elongation factor GreA [Anaerolineae bacterium]|jgi:transcription elongation factor GreA
MEQPEFLTREGYENLERELVYLTTVRRSEVAQRLHQALEEDWDLLESSELEDARNEQAFLEGRIQMLKGVLSNAVLIEETESHDRVELGSYVTIVDLDGDGAPETYRVVGSAEANPISGSISNESPLGRGLVGRRVGDQIDIDAPGGRMVFRIVEIR